MRLVALVGVLTLACSATPTTLTVNVATDSSSINADEVGVELNNDAATTVVFPSTTFDDAGDPAIQFPTSVVLILPADEGGQRVPVVAYGLLGESNDAATSLNETCVAEGEISLAIVARQNNVTTVVCVRPLERRSDRQVEGPGPERDSRACARDVCLLLTRREGTGTRRRQDTYWRRGARAACLWANSRVRTE